MKRVLIFMTFALGLASAQTQDIDGWGKIRWGMTIAEAASAYNVTTQPEVNEYWTNLVLGSVDIGDTKMIAHVSVKHGHAGISSVSLWDKLGNSFDTLRVLLIQKYNLPVMTEHGVDSLGNRETTLTWTLPSTSVVLEQNVIGVHVRYDAIDKKASDKL
jgi:hypothetical protein